MTQNFNPMAGYTAPGFGNLGGVTNVNMANPAFKRHPSLLAALAPYVNAMLGPGGPFSMDQLMQELGLQSSAISRGAGEARSRVTEQVSQRGGTRAQSETAARTIDTAVPGQIAKAGVERQTAHKLGRAEVAKDVAGAATAEASTLRGEQHEKEMIDYTIAKQKELIDSQKPKLGEILLGAGLGVAAGALTGGLSSALMPGMYQASTMGAAGSTMSGLSSIMPGGPLMGMGMQGMAQNMMPNFWSQFMAGVGRADLLQWAGLGATFGAY